MVSVVGLGHSDAGSNPCTSIGFVGKLMTCTVLCWLGKRFTSYLMKLIEEALQGVFLNSRAPAPAPTTLETKT